jgi:hypothetical protein
VKTRDGIPGCKPEDRSTDGSRQTYAGPLGNATSRA